MPNINITVAGKIATNTTPGVVIVCGNSDYTVTFDLDAEWDAEPNRTARFVFYRDGLRLYKDVEFTGSTATTPVLSGIDYVEVGVYAGDLRTTTPARVLCDRSILCGDPMAVPPTKAEQLQAQIGDLSQLETSDKSSLVAAINEAAKTGGTTGSDSSGNGNGLSDTASALLITILRNGLYNVDQSANITALETALGSSGESSGGDSGETEKTLTGISTVYSGGSVPVGTAVSALTGIVVTAHYSDGSATTVTGYTLSGTIAEGENTVTVTYQGMTTSFAVTGVADTTGGDTDETLLYNWDFTKSLTDSVSGEVASLNGSATQDGGGVHLTALTDYVGLGDLVTAVNRAYELDMGDMERSGTGHGRLLVQDSTAGFMYRNSGYWTWWSGQGWCESTGLTGFSDIANKTIRIEVDVNHYHTLYVDGTQIAKSSLPVAHGSGTANDAIRDGLAVTLGSSNGNTAMIAAIKAFRVYNLEVAE